MPNPNPKSQGAAQAMVVRRLEAYRQRARVLFQREAQHFERRMIRRHLSGPVTGPETLRRRTGTLARSLGYRIEDRPQGLTLHVFAGRGSQKVKDYARAHEFGAVIQGRPWLAIPLNRTRAGVSRLVGKVVGGFWIRSKRGNPMLVTAGKRGKIIPQLVLVRKVTLPPRMSFRREWGVSQGLLREKLRAEADKMFGGRRLIKRRITRKGGRR